MQEGKSIRSSHYNARPLALQKAKQSVQEEVVSLLDKHVKGVRNILRAENADILKKHTFYAIPRLGRDVPGFLVFRPDATYFYNPRREETYRLRLRVSSEMRTSGTILIGSLYYMEKKLVLEDVYRWQGKLVWETDTFETRWERLREFFSGHFTQDLYLQKNLEILPTRVLSLEEAAGSLDPEMGCDFVPSVPKRKRFFWFSGEKVARHDRILAPPFKPEPRKPTKISRGEAPKPAAPQAVKEELEVKAEEPATQPTPACPTNKKLALARARPHESLPDVYHLFDLKDSTPLGLGSVQEFSTSQQLAAAKPDTIVKVRWNDDFEKYQILGLK